MPCSIWWADGSHEPVLEDHPTVRSRQLERSADEVCRSRLPTSVQQEVSPMVDMARVLPLMKAFDCSTADATLGVSSPWRQRSLRGTKSTLASSSPIESDSVTGRSKEAFGGLRTE
jgi:hypothetical protein